MNTIVFRISKWFLKRVLLWYGMLCYAMLCYAMESMVCYNISMLCYEISMLCYAMVYVEKDKHSATGGYEGRLILDEMSIQPDLQFYCKDGRHHLIGFTDLGEESYLMNSIQNGKNEVKLATHVLQFTFLGFSTLSLSYDAGFSF